ncbi:MAG TPA: hypothetical protein VGF17_30820 [Phytomonospora sp.]|uniref:Integral membrane protein n=1 Tax=Streptodolium elevatio TaxID=3157996 RepID=A0ABV3DN65_9ACTN
MTGVPYGIEVSSEPAIRHPGVREKLNSSRRSGRSFSFGCTAVFAALAAGAFVAAALWSGVMAVVGGVLVIVVLAGVVVIAASGAEDRHLSRVLNAYTWQAWPARWAVDAEEGTLFADLESTDGRTVRMAVPDLGDDVFGDRADGEHLWFAGDARFGGVLARPGVPTWIVSVMRETLGDEPGSELADRTAREAKLMPKGRHPAR